MMLEDIIEKIKRLDSGGNGNNIVCFVVAFDFLYFLKDADNRERFIYEYYKNDNVMFTSSFKKICFYSESILLEDDVYHKMLDSIEMDVKRDDLVSLYNYYDAIDRIERANNSPKDMISDGFKIRLLKNVFDSSNEDFVSLDKKVNVLKDRYDRNIIDIVTIISVFIAISIGMVSGISFSLQAFSNFTNENYLTISLITIVIGFVIFNLFYSLFRFVSKIAGKSFDEKGYVLFIDIVFVLIMVFLIVINKFC